MSARPQGPSSWTETEESCWSIFAGGDEPGLANGWWACPGGGIDPDETVTQGLIRELDEELGLRIDDPGSAVWRKRHLFPMTNWDGQHDTYFLIEVDAFEPRPRYNPDVLEGRYLRHLLPTQQWPGPAAPDVGRQHSARGSGRATG